MYLKIHETNNSLVVAVCDKELIGKVLKEGEYFLDLETHKSFYVGKLATKEEVEAALKRPFSSANLVGKKAVKIALNLSLTTPDNIIFINGYPIIQIYRL